MQNQGRSFEKALFRLESKSDFPIWKEGNLISEIEIKNRTFLGLVWDQTVDMEGEALEIGATAVKFSLVSGDDDQKKRSEKLFFLYFFWFIKLKMVFFIGF